MNDVSNEYQQINLKWVKKVAFQQKKQNNPESQTKGGNTGC